MKKLVLLVSIISFSLVNYGQTFRLGGGPVLSAPVGNLQKMNSIGVGVELTGILEFSESFQAFGQVGYQNFLPKSMTLLGTTVRGESLSHVPFLFGGRYVSNSFLAGAAFGYGTYGKGSSGFTFSPQVGYSLDKIDIIGNYTSTSVGGASLAYFGIKTHYKF